MEYDLTQLRRIDLIDQQSLVRCLSPELMLVDPELARRARELLHEPGESNGKGNMSTVLGTHEMSSGIVLGLEPPLSPPVVHGPSAMTTAGPSAHVDLPSPPPALRPPESSMASEPAPTPEPAPVPVAPEVPAQPEQAAPPPPPPPAPAPAPTPVQQEQEPLMAPPLEPVAPQAPEPSVIELKPVSPAQEPEPEIAASAPAPAEPEPPAMAPEPPPAPPEPETAPPTEDHLEVPEQPLAPPPPAEPPLPEIQVLAPPAPVEERIELPAVESLTPPAPEPPAAEEPTIEPAFELPVNGSQPGAFRVVVRLSDGDGVEVGEFRDFGTAMQGAQEVIDQFSHSNGSWPFYAGRFIRPDLIISVDVVDGAAS